MRIIIVIRFEVVDILNDNAYLFGRQIIGDVRAVRFHSLFVKRAGYGIVKSESDKGVIQFAQTAFVHGLTDKNETNGKKACDDCASQQKMLKQIVVFGI